MSRRSVCILHKCCRGSAIAALFFTLSLSARAQEDVSNDSPAPPRKSRAVVHAKALSLEEMSKEADKIFQGTVEQIVEKRITISQGGKEADVDVQEVTFKVGVKIKGKFDGSTTSIRQLATFAQPVKKGEEVVMYLASVSEIGFTAPLGIYSGHFKVQALEDGEGEQQSKVAMNLKGNEGLWPEDAPLLATSADWRAAFSEKVDDATGEAEAQRVFQAAALPNRRGPLPLQLITAATQAFLETEQPPSEK